MKATGIVRRIDDLGRVVIPKEIRRTLRIKEGDPLEIYTNKDGSVIFKKYSPIGELAEFSDVCCEILSKVADLPVLICDTEHVVAVAGAPKNEFVERRIAPALEELMETRNEFIAKSEEAEAFLPVEGVNKAAAVAFPINSAGDVSGAVIMLKSDKKQSDFSAEAKLAQTIALFLGKYIEN